MKKLIYLFLALFTVFSYGQADFPEGIQISGGQPTVSTVNFLTTTELNGVQGKIDPVNLPFATKEIVFENNKKWVLFGDSISNTLVDPDYPFYTIQKLGLTGTVTNAVAGNVSGQQLTILQNLLSTNPNYFNDFDIATLLVGVNDWATNVPLGGRNSSSSDNNYAGHVKKIIELILAAKPTLRLYVMTPFEIYYADPINGPINSEGYTLRDMSVLVSQICSDYSVQCIDLYSTVQINKITIPSLLSDGIHPNSAGAKIIGDLVADAFLSKSNIGKVTDLSTGGEIPNGKFLTLGDTSPSNSVLRLLSKDGYNYIQTGKGDSLGTANDLIFTGNYGANELLRLKTNAELVAQNKVTSPIFETSSTVNTDAYSIAGYGFARYSTGDILDFGAFGNTWQGVRILVNNSSALGFDNDGRGTFSKPVSGVNAFFPTDLATLQQVTGLDANNVKLTGNQNIGGLKRFTNGIQSDGKILFTTDVVLGASAASIARYGGELLISGSGVSNTYFTLKSNSITSTLFSYVMPKVSGQLITENQVKDNIVTSSNATITLANNAGTMYYTYTGSAPVTWNLPDASANTKLRYVIINQGTGTITLNGTIWDSGSSVTTTGVAVGGSMELYSNGINYTIL